MRTHQLFSTFLLCFTLASTALAVTKPTLPQYQVNTDLSNSPVTGRSITVASGGDIQAAINSANPGDEIVLQAGGSWTGQYVLPNKGQTTSWITIRSSAVSSLPGPGTRVSPNDAANMPKIMADGTAAAFTFAKKANHYRLIGLEITEQPKQYLNYGLIMQGDPNDPDPTDLPSYITVDRCYIHGDALSHIKFGWQMNGSYLALIDSYVSEMHGIGQDAQAVMGYMGTGPLKIANNFLEGAAENVMFGGAYDAIPNTTTADVTLTNNYLSKPFAWQNTIVPQPNLTAVNGLTGGTLAPGTYYYAVIAQGTAGTLTAPGSCQSSRSNELAVTVAPGQNAVSLQWTESSYGDGQDTRIADNYVVLRSQNPPGAANRTWTYYVMTPTAGATTLTFTDNGSSNQTGYSEWPRYWDIKNLLEIKNGVRMLVDSNVMEGNWFSAQDGFSILFTPRNETQFMPGNRVSDITFSNNVVRHVSGGINVASEDDLQAPADSAQEQATARLAFVNNLFEDVSTSYGGEGVFAELQSSTAVGLPPAHDLLFDHNTIFQNGNVADIYVANGALQDVSITNNVFGEGTYGWYVNVLGQSYGALAQALGGLTFADNVWAGQPTIFQFAGNFYPATLPEVGFENYNNGNGGDYHLVAGSPYKGLATDGTDPGINADLINTVILQSTTGRSSAASSSSGSTGTTSGTVNSGSAPGGSSSSAGGTPVPVTTPSAPTSSTPAPIASNAVWFAIASVNSGKCLTVQPDQTVAQYTCSAANNSQMFRLSPVLDGSQNLTGYEIYSRVGSGLGLNVWGNTPNNGAVVGIYLLSGQPNELFSLNPDHAGNFAVVPKNSGSCLDITAVSKADGARLQQWPCNGQTNQSFDFVMLDASAQSGSSFNSSSGTGATTQTLWFAIASVNSGKCVTVQSDWTTVQDTCSAGNAAQLFRLSPVLDSSQNFAGYEIYSRTGQGLGLNVWGATANPGALVGLHPLSGQANEIFSLNPDRAGNFTIVPKNSGSCFDITAVSKADGARMQQWTCNGQTNQAFDFVLADAS